MGPTAQLLAGDIQIEMPLESPPQSELDFDAPYIELVPIFQPEIDKAQAERDEANRLSDWRAEKAPVIGALVFASEGSRWSRVGAVAVVGKVWYSDHEDGVYARRSKATAESVIADYPEAAEHPQIMRLLSQEVQTDGGERDQKADKVLTNEINKGLLARALHSGDFAAAAILGSTIELTTVRDQVMATIRSEGVNKHVNICAKSLGKLKTVMLASGQAMMVGSKTGSAVNRTGLGLIGASNAPSWGAVLQMKRSVKRQIATSRLTSEKINSESTKKYQELLADQYVIDLEGEPVEALRVA